MKKILIKKVYSGFVWTFFVITVAISGCKKENKNSPAIPPGPGNNNDSYTVSTIAGSNSKGFSDGTGADAIFSLPAGVALDGSDNIYVADAGNYRIRKITSAGVVTTLAGKSTWGTFDGIGLGAGFTSPWGIALDGSGNIYVTDDCAVRKISPDTVVTTLAGNWLPGYAEGTGTAAKFGSHLRGIVLDASGNIYVADGVNNRIRKITPGGVVTTFAGSGTSGFADGIGTAAQFAGPVGMAIDASGNIYVADLGNSTVPNLLVRKITPAAEVSTLYKTSGSIGAVANPISASGIALDASGNIYLGDVANDIIVEVTPAGAVSKVAGSGIGFADGEMDNAKFNNIPGLAVNPSGNIYAADLDNHRIRKITKQ